MSETGALAAAALVAGAITGVLGAGGAIVFIPLLAFAFPSLGGPTIDVHAITALAAVQGLVAILAAAITSDAGATRGQALAVLAPGLALGALVGGILSSSAPARLLLMVYAVIASSAAAGLLFVRPRAASRLPPLVRTPLAAGSALGIGALGGTIGVGGGFLLIPLLVYVIGIPPREARATGLVAALFLIVPALVGKVASGQLPWPLVPAVTVGAVIGGGIGGATHRYLPATAGRVFLGVMVSGVAAYTWWRLFA